MTTKPTTRPAAARGTGILLLHGLCGSPAEMRFVANGLAREGYMVHCPQLDGQTGAMAAIASSTWHDWYASAERGLAELVRSCDTVIVGGLSTGAVRSLLLAARRPDIVDATLLFAPTLWANGPLVPWYTRLFRMVPHKRLANLIRFSRGEPHAIKDPRIRDLVRNVMSSGESASSRLSRLPGGVALEHRRLVASLLRVVGTIEQPALLVHSREDGYADLGNASFLMRRLRGVVETVVLSDSYHMVTMDRERHLVLARAARFVADLVHRRDGARPGKALAAAH